LVYNYEEIVMLHRMGELTMMSLWQWWEKEIQKLWPRRGVIQCLCHSSKGSSVSALWFPLVEKLKG